MDPNQNPPSDREWTEQEREEFLASADPIMGLPNVSLAGAPAIHSGWTNKVRMPNFVKEVERYLNSIPNPPPIEWSTSAWNGPLIKLDPDDPFGHMKSLFSSGIHITSIVPPEQGWPIVAHCNMCRKTEIVLSPWAIKPEKGDYWKMNMCAHETLGFEHNILMGMQGYYTPIDLKPGGRPL